VTVWYYLLYAAIGYLSGSVLYCQILPQWLAGKNIAALSDDHNPGAFNVFTHCGIPLGSLCLALELAKGLIPVLIAVGRLDPRHFLFAPVIAAPVLGHAFSAWHRFDGGKGIAVGFGVMLGMFPFTLSGLILAGIFVFFSTIHKIQPHRRRSIVTYLLFAVIATPLLLWQQKAAVAVGYLLIDAVIIIKHLMGTGVSTEEDEAIRRRDG
jgi:glycerol-3-phosphate acyltransferase PlsY